MKQTLVKASVIFFGLVENVCLNSRTKCLCSKQTLLAVSEKILLSSFWKCLPLTSESRVSIISLFSRMGGLISGVGSREGKGEMPFLWVDTGWAFCGHACAACVGCFAYNFSEDRPSSEHVHWSTSVHLSFCLRAIYHH